MPTWLANEPDTIWNSSLWQARDSGLFLPPDNANALNFQQSGGGNLHFRGSQDKGKTCLLVHTYRQLIKKYGYSPSEAVGNLTLQSWNEGYQVLKGDDLHQYLWDMTHKPYRHKIVIIDEIDSEFPARFFQSREQTEIALRMWHNRKLRNYILYTSHLGKGADLIFDLATNYELIPRGINWSNATIPFTVINGFDLTVDRSWVAHDIFTTMSNYDRWEMTEKTAEDSIKKRPVSKARKTASETVTRDGIVKLKEGLKEAKQNAIRKKKDTA